VLAADVLAEDAVRTPAADIFRDVAAGPAVWRPTDAAACGCPAAD
jgi:hypothetical protein